MPFLSSTTALTVYTLESPSAVTFEKLKQYAFCSIDELPEERGIGWTNIEDMFDTEWRLSPPELGSFMCFSMRIDTRKVPAAVLKKHLSEGLREEEAKAQAEGRNVSRSRKKELKERLLFKLRSKAEPVPTAVDVAVDMSNGLVLVSTISGGQLELIEAYFETTFDAKLNRWELDTSQGQQALSAIYANRLEPSIDGFTWSLEEAGQAALIHPESGAKVNVKEEPEAVSKALDSGLELVCLKCRLVRQDDESLEWTFSLSASGAITGLKTPKVEKQGGDLEAALLEKLHLITQAVSVIREVMKGN